jgi:hypothetical protein
MPDRAGAGQRRVTASPARSRFVKQMPNTTEADLDIIMLAIDVELYQIIHPSSPLEVEDSKNRKKSLCSLGHGDFAIITSNQEPLFIT